MGRVKSPATVRRYVSSIVALHKALRQANPLDSAVVRFALQRMRRRRGRRQAQVQGLTWPLRKRLLEATGDRLIDARNRALLAVGYDKLLRRSELVSLQVPDLLEEIDGTATLLVCSGKTDPDGRGATLYLALARDTVQLVTTWLELGGVDRGRLFRSVRKDGTVGEQLDSGPAVLTESARRYVGEPRGFQAWSPPRSPSGDPQRPRVLCEARRHANARHVGRTPRRLTVTCHNAELVMMCSSRWWLTQALLVCRQADAAPALRGPRRPRGGCRHWSGRAGPGRDWAVARALPRLTTAEMARSLIACLPALDRRPAPARRNGYPGSPGWTVMDRSGLKSSRGLKRGILLITELQKTPFLLRFSRSSPSTRRSRRCRRRARGSSCGTGAGGRPRR